MPIPSAQTTAEEVNRTLLDREFEAVLERGLKNYKPTLPADASEDDILAEADRITRRR